MTDCVWKLSDMPEEARAISKTISTALCIPSIVADLMVQRGIKSARDGEAFLRADLADLEDPHLLKDIDKAVERISRGIEENERIVVYGDYDVDGITSICILVDVLRGLGANVDYYIPDRVDEGYGINQEAVASIAKDCTSLLITVDCGITASSEVQLAQSLGMDVIVTDHHEPSAKIPPAVAVINPKRHDEEYPFRDLAGVGVAYKLSQALVTSLKGPKEARVLSDRFLDLVALGTIADVSPLVGENRIFAKQGLARINRTENIGLQCLIEVCGLKDRTITAGTVGFVLAPRLNAAGRIRDPALCVELLLTDSPQRAMSIARLLDSVNSERQRLEMKTLEEALSMVKTCDGRPVDCVLVLAKEGWHPGVIGIVASRIVEEFNRPAFLITLDGDEGRGSGRSIPEFDLYRALSQCSDTLLGFGGHKYAAGITVSRHGIDRFRQAINEVGRSVLCEEDFLPKVFCHLELTLDRIDLEVAKGIAMLAPFGFGNPTPLFLSTGVELLEYRGVGADGKHLKMVLAQAGKTHDGIGFGLGHLTSQIYSERANEVDIVYTIEVNEWNGMIRPQLNIKGLRIAENHG
ncbi:MAG: single-stranded-DNA-specific exonuclease RecJ [Bacillota bacterium]